MSVRGFEPRTTWLKVKCSTNWATRPSSFEDFSVQITLSKKEGWVKGLEPLISRTTIWRANQLHHTHHITLSNHLRPTKYRYSIFSGSNEPGGIRTLDLRLRRPLLYPAELQTHFSQNLFQGLKKAGDGNRTHVSSLEGWCSTIELHPHENRGDRIRTCDLLVPNQAL